MTFEYQELVTDLYRTFGTPVTLLDRADRLLAFSDQPAELSDEFRRENLLVDARHTARGRAVIAHVNATARSSRALTRIPGRPELGLLPRTVVPLLLDGTPVAYVYFIDPAGAITDESLETFAGPFATVARQIEMERLARAKVRSAVLGLISSDPDGRRLAASAIEDLSLPRLGPPHRVVAVSSDADLSRVPDGSWRRLFGRDSVWADVQERVIAVARAGKDADAVLRAAGHDDGAIVDAPLFVGVGSPVDGMSETHRSYREAVRCLRLAESVATDSRFALWDELGSWRILLSNDPDHALEAADARVRRLVSSEPAETLSLVRQYLDRELDADRIAASHHLHRTTLYAKMRRLQERYGLSWEAADDRLATVLAIRLAQLTRRKGLSPPS
jgi:hypothetical protein